MRWERGQILTPQDLSPLREVKKTTRPKKTRSNFFDGHVGLNGSLFFEKAQGGGINDNPTHLQSEGVGPPDLEDPPPEN